MTKETRLNILHYIAEAYAHVNRSEDLMRTIEIIKQETDFESRETHSAVYASHNGDNIESVEEQTEQSLFEHLTTFGQSREGNLKAVA